MSAEDHLQALRSEIADLGTNIANGRSDLDLVKKEVEAAQKERETVKLQLLEFSKLCGSEKTKLTQQIEALTKENTRLTTENATLVHTKGQLMQDNITLSKQNEHFRGYEAKAIKVLRTTEDSLIQREKAILQKEQFKNDKSILPPNN